MTIDIKCLHLFPSQEIKMFCRAGIALLISTELMIKGQTHNNNKKDRSTSPLMAGSEHAMWVSIMQWQVE